MLRVSPPYFFGSCLLAFVACFNPSHPDVLLVSAVPVDEPMDTTAAPQVQELSQKMHTNQQSKKGQKRRKG